MKIARRLAAALLLAVALSGCGGAAPGADAHLKTTEATSTAIFVHGGGWVAGSPEAGRPLVVRFGVWGLTLDLATYRLIPEVDLAGEVGDVRAEIDRVRGTSTAPIIVVGHSAGAHLAATAVLQARSATPVCLILLDGIGYDLPQLLTDRPALQTRLGLTPEQALPWSPTALLAPPPVRIFVAAGNDARDTRGQGEAFALIARLQGFDAQFLHYPDMDHSDFLQHFQQAPPSEFLKAVARFVRDCADIPTTGETP
jgi:acetyl esterase/lipase